ncbi:MAG TPA: 2-oxoglutarate dehydrogenase complex dihydrolipoyllysine-residue succinyltransferase, partial [Terriglobia bacterium]|nr:2-oxoglutarate dehydrogenase complex dihydrolipoyllysine-residue succinyltransferase [Terriglobia bacterium]
VQGGEIVPTKIVVPELGESVVEATVGHWRKQQGERVAVGDVLVDLETEKVDLEVGAERAGVLARIERKEGEDVKIGDLLGVIEEAPAEEAAAAKADGARPSEKKAPKEVEARPQAGAAVAARQEAEEEAAEAAPKRLVTPLARRVAEEHGVDLSRVQPSDAAGRIQKRDVESFLQTRHAETAAAPKPAETPAPSSQPAPHIVPPQAPAGRPRLEERVRMSRRRQTIARRLVEAQHSAAMLTTFNEVDMTGVMQLRARWKENFKRQHGVSLGIASFFVKASIGALRQFPHLNAEVQGTDMVLKRYYDIGVAVGASEGLVVPVLRDADQLSFADIETAIKEFARKASAGELTLEELRGGTFTISNGGVYGSLLSTPILNPPQVGILGLHKIENRAVPVEGKIEIRSMMYIALSYDHRLVDGMEAVQFLVRVKELVEDPASLLFAL